jgi:hypothetical protein
VLCEEHRVFHDASLRIIRRAQRACHQGIGASGPKELVPQYYSKDNMNASAPEKGNYIRRDKII